MRKNILICLLLVLTAGFGTLYCAGPETPVPTWERTYGGSERDILKDCIQTTNGDYVMVGYTLSSDITLRNAIVIKTDGNGNTLWEKTFWSPFRTTGSGSYLNSVKETGDGGYIIAGETVVEETWLLKLDQDGNKEWERQLYSGPNQFGFTTTVMVTEEGDFVLSGYSGIYNNADAWLAKVDDGGDVIWQKTFASNYKTYIHAMDATSDNGYILAGHKQIGSSHNGVLIKTDSSGNLEWTKLYGGSEIDFIYDVKHTGDGGYVFNGISQS
ncbi:MAG: PQQ-binding-like beta-propeller repeat protein [bacterium]|nr:PQQ-binding-like beta-propeller repeat protein [bacterium]